MAISSTPYSDCDCCGYGFEMFEQPGIVYPDYFYIVSGGASQNPLNLRKYGKDLVHISHQVITGVITPLQINNLENFSEVTVPTSSPPEIHIKVWDRSSFLFDNSNYEITLVLSNPQYNNSFVRVNMAEESTLVFAGSFFEWNGLPGASGKGKLHCRTIKLASDGLTEIWNEQENYTGSFPVASQFCGYGVRNVAISSNGSRYHIIGARTADNTACGPFHFQYDTDGNLIWSEISSNTDKRRVGVSSSFLKNGNIVSLYSSNGAITPVVDSKMLVGHDPTGSEIFSYNVSDLGGDIASMRSRNNGLYIRQGAVFKKLSGSALSTVEWSANLGIPTPGIWEVDPLGDVYILQGNDIVKLSGDDGSEVARTTIGDAALFNLFMPPGFAPLFF